MEIGLRLDAEKFSNLYINAYPRLVVIAAALVQDRTEACDIVQQSAVVAIERIDQFVPTSADSGAIEFARWMAAIVRNVARNSRRKQHIRRAVSLSDADAISPANHAHPDRKPNAEELGFDVNSRTFFGVSDAFDDQLRRALQSLSETSRICLLLNVVLHVTLDEIGQLLDMSPGTVASHVSRAKKSLRDLLHDYRGPTT